LNNLLEKTRSRIMDLIRAFDIIAKNLLAYRSIKLTYSLISILLPMYAVILLSSSIVLGIGQQYIIRSTIILVGVIGSTAYFIHWIIIIRRINKHIEYSKYFNSHLDDLFKILDYRLSDEAQTYLERLLSIDNIPIEYLPPLLILPYLSIIVLNAPLLALALLVAFIAVTASFLAISIGLFNKHITCENKILGEKRIFFKHDEFEEYTPYNKGVFETIVLPLITMGFYLVYLLINIDEFLEKHVIIHRRNYRLFKTLYLKKVKETESVAV
jgi:hypothetical protein